MDAAALTGGFADPSRAAARAFRVALDCMARPGRVGRLAAAAPPDGLSPAAGTLLLALADADTPVWLAPGIGAAVEAWLAFHANAPRTTVPETAVFAVGAWTDLQPLEQWPAGTPTYPDRGATLIVETPALEGGAPLVLSGPGVAGETRIAPRLPDAAGAALAANAARYPLGLDVFLTAGEAVVALPRSSRIGG